MRERRGKQTRGIPDCQGGPFRQPQAPSDDKTANSRGCVRPLSPTLKRSAR